MAKLVLFYKPYRVLSQFTDESGRRTLADFIPLKNVYAAGRLDYDSEGLLLLTDDGRLQQQLAHPKSGKYKYYWVQVEGIPTEEQLDKLRSGLTLKDGPTKPALVEMIEAPQVPPRNPPIRERETIPTCWLEIGIREGRNRQVRRMTAAIDHPTLRLIRHRVDQYRLGKLKPGEFQVLEVPSPKVGGSKAKTGRRNRRKRRRPGSKQ